MPLTWLQRPAQLFCRISHILDLLLPRCVPLSPLFPTMEISFRNFQTQLFGEQEYLISSTVTFIWITLEGTWLPGCPALNNTKIDKQVQLGSTGSHVLGLAWWSSGEDSTLPMQGMRVQLGNYDPTCCGAGHKTNKKAMFHVCMIENFLWLQRAATEFILNIL